MSFFLGGEILFSRRIVLRGRCSFFFLSFFFPIVGLSLEKSERRGEANTGVT